MLRTAAAFSPIAPTGIISTFFVTKMAPELATLGQPLGDINLLAWKIHFNSEVAQLLVNIGGFFILGGWTWMMSQKHASLDMDELAPKPEPFDRNQKLTIAAIVLLVLLVILPSLPGTKELFTKDMLNLLGNGRVANIGAVAFILGTVLLLTEAGDSRAAVKSMPWTVIIMVCGMGVLIDVMDKAGGLNALVKIIASISNPTSVNGVLGVVTGIISAYSSSSGVVVPMFLPLVPGLIKEMGGGNAIAMISSINVGAHLVDTSPLSTPRRALHRLRRRTRRQGQAVPQPADLGLLHGLRRRLRVLRHVWPVQPLSPTHNTGTALFARCRCKTRRGHVERRGRGVVLRHHCNGLISANVCFGTRGREHGRTALARRIVV